MDYFVLSFLAPLVELILRRNKVKLEDRKFHDVVEIKHKGEGPPGGVRFPLEPYMVARIDSSFDLNLCKSEKSVSCFC